MTRRSTLLVGLKNISRKQFASAVLDCLHHQTVEPSVDISTSLNSGMLQLPKSVPGRTDVFFGDYDTSPCTITHNWDKKAIERFWIRALRSNYYPKEVAPHKITQFWVSLAP